MSEKPSILLKNIYYMLAYAFRNLEAGHYEDVEKEDFDHTHDLFAAILSKGIARQLKQGLHREYVEHIESLSALRGKLDFPGTVKHQAARRRELSCEFDELSRNNLLNQILKSAAILLIKHGEVGNKHKDALKRSMLSFADVDQIDLADVDWSRVRLMRNTQSYRMLLGVSKLLAEGMLFSTEAGEYKLMSFIEDSQMHRLYEDFLLAYYETHWPRLRPSAPKIPWALEEGTHRLLPTMQSDLMLTDGETALIIDAKYYTQNLQIHYDRSNIHSAHLYQLFSYVTNKQVQGPEGVVSGMLLYAKTDYEVQPAGSWVLNGLQISSQALDLGQNFESVCDQLDAIVAERFGLSRDLRVA